jgi:hypothetical protein
VNSLCSRSSPLLEPILNHMNTFDVSTSHRFQIHITIIGIWKNTFHWGFSAKSLCEFLFSSYVLLARLSHYPWFKYPNIIWWRYQIIERTNMHYPSLCYLLSLQSKYLRRQPGNYTQKQEYIATSVFINIDFSSVSLFAWGWECWKGSSRHDLLFEWNLTAIFEPIV